MKEEDYPIIEYIHPLKPNVTMFKCYIGDGGYHSDDVSKIEVWRKDQVDNAELYAEQRRLTNLAMELYMQTVKYKD
jgi:hypothetical protein